MEKLLGVLELSGKLDFYETIEFEVKYDRKYFVVEHVHPFNGFSF